MQNFKLAIGNRMQYAAMIGLFDLGPRLALWRQFNAGLWKSWGTSKPDDSDEEYRPF